MRNYFTIRASVSWETDSGFILEPVVDTREPHWHLPPLPQAQRHFRTLKNEKSVHSVKVRHQSFAIFGHWKRSQLFEANFLLKLVGVPTFTEKITDTLPCSGVPLLLLYLPQYPRDLACPPATSRPCHNTHLSRILPHRPPARHRSTQLQPPSPLNLKIRDNMGSLLSK